MTFPVKEGQLWFGGASTWPHLNRHGIVLAADITVQQLIIIITKTTSYKFVEILTGVKIPPCASNHQQYWHHQQYPVRSTCTRIQSSREGRAAAAAGRTDATHSIIIYSTSVLRYNTIPAMGQHEI